MLGACSQVRGSLLHYTHRAVAAQDRVKMASECVRSLSREYHELMAGRNTEWDEWELQVRLNSVCWIRGLKSSTLSRACLWCLSIDVHACIAESYRLTGVLREWPLSRMNRQRLRFPSRPHALVHASRPRCVRVSWRS